MSILIVDDTPDNILLLQAMLKKEGFQELLCASSAKEAFQHLGLSETVTSQNVGVDLILMDVMMPEISGIEACEKIKSVEALREIPLIMVTARTDMESLDTAFSVGAMDYITKPIRKIELLARVRSALRLKQEMDCRKLREEELKHRNQELEKAMQEIKVLRGFLPICSHCKKIRNMQGCWEQMEAYLMQHSDVKFSHGICDHCLKANYPEIL